MLLQTSPARQDDVAECPDLRLAAAALQVPCQALTEALCLPSCTPNKQKTKMWQATILATYMSPSDAQEACYTRLVAALHLPHWGPIKLGNRSKRVAAFSVDAGQQHEYCLNNLHDKPVQWTVCT